MRHVGSGILLLLAVGLGASGLRPVEAAPAGVDIDGLRKTVVPRVCWVMVLNEWGLPLAYANGFLLGQGRFVVTDLASVSQPGAARAVLTFADGSTASALQFGLADPGTGLAALCVETGKATSAGLELAQTVPALDGSATVATAGWRWCKDADVAVGRLVRGPLVRDLAQLCGIQAPEVGEVFLRLEGGRLDGAGGARSSTATAMSLPSRWTLPRGTSPSPLLCRPPRSGRRSWRRSRD